MAKPKPDTSSSSKSSSSWFFSFLVSVLIIPVAAAVLLYLLESFDPASLPTHKFPHTPVTSPRVNPRLLQESEMIGAGKLFGPEDIAYDAKSGIIYTGCFDGWVKRVTFNDSVVHDWAFTGGRPLGVALGRAGEVLVADADKVQKIVFSFPKVLHVDYGC